jgi:hypothetical protein
MNTKEKKDIRTVIDTQEITIDINNLNTNKLQERERVEEHRLLKAIKYGDNLNLKNSKVKLVIKVHNIFKEEDKEHYISSLSEYKNIFENILKNIDVEDMEKVYNERVDIAIDMDIDFVDNFKKLLYFFCLVTAHKSDINKWLTINFETLDYNTIRLDTRSLKIAFYDKAFESNGKAEYKTRLEFRFMRLKNYSLDKYLDKLINLLKNSDDNIGYIEEVMINKLIERYEKELKEDNIPFDEFVRQYKKFIYTNNILKALHKKCCNNKYEYWIKNFRKKYKIKLISYAEINNFKKNCIRAIKQYKRS